MRFCSSKWSVYIIWRENLVWMKLFSLKSLLNLSYKRQLVSIFEWMLILCFFGLSGFAKGNIVGQEIKLPENRTVKPQPTAALFILTPFVCPLLFLKLCPKPHKTSVLIWTASESFNWNWVYDSRVHFSFSSDYWMTE